MPRAVLGYAARATGLSLELFTYEPPKLKEHDVRVSVTHCGICYTDIHAVEDYYGITTYPFVPVTRSSGTCPTSALRQPD